MLHLFTNAYRSQRRQPARAHAPGWLLALSLMVMLAGCGNNQPSGRQPVGQPSAVAAASAPGPIAGPLADPGLDLHAGPVDVPLELKIPSLSVSAPVVGVGLTAANLMDAPQGPADDPVWQKVFWYRGSGIPGDSGTATAAAHVNDVLGRPAVFARLKDLKPGELILVHDTRTAQDVRFTVVKSETYSRQQSADPVILAQIYGAGPLSGKGPQPAADGRAHLTLITCDGDFVNGSYDHHLVVYADRSN